MAIKKSAAILALVVKRHRQDGGGVSELSCLVDDLAQSTLSETEIAARFEEAFTE